MDKMKDSILEIKNLLKEYSIQSREDYLNKISI